MPNREKKVSRGAWHIAIIILCVVGEYMFSPRGIIVAKTYFSPMPDG